MCSPRPRSKAGATACVGLKENVIIGKLIPAGTGMNRYRDIDTHAPDYEPLPFYSSDTDADGDLDLAAWLADTSAIHARRGRGRVRGGRLRRSADGELGDITELADAIVTALGSEPDGRAVHAWTVVEATDDVDGGIGSPTTSGTLAAT